MKAVLAIAAFSTISGLASCSSDFGGNHNNYNNNRSPPRTGSSSSSSSPFLYSEINSQELFSPKKNNPDDTTATTTSSSSSSQQEELPEPFYFHLHDDESDSTLSDEASVVSSSLMYEGGCYVSSQAMMCSGGDVGGASVATSGRDPMNVHQQDSDVEYYFHESELEDDDEEEDDDDDDDDNDGHSSMLSNASLRRKVSASGLASSGSSPSNKSSAGRSFISSSCYMEGQTNWKTKTNKGTGTMMQTKAKNHALLVLRGGASASASATKSVVGNELAKKLFVSALVTLIFEGLIGHVLEFFKIVMQTSPPGTTYAQIYKDITSQKGISGLWDGFAPWGVIQAVLKGGVFGLAHAAATKILLPIAREENSMLPMKVAMTLAGGIGGGFQGYVLSPTLLMKTRVMTNPVFREQMSLLRTTWLSFCIGYEVVKTEGILTLMKGANVFATKRVFDWASRYYFSDLIEELYVKFIKGGSTKTTTTKKTSSSSSSLTTTEKSVASFLGGVASTVVTLPLDVLVAKVQDAKKAGVQVSPFRLFLDELDDSGWSGLRETYMRGFTARLLHVCLTTVVMKTGVPIVYDMIFNKSTKTEKNKNKNKK